MKLTMTHYIDADTATVAPRLRAAAAAGLDAAAERTAAQRTSTMTTMFEDGIHIDGGLDALTGTDCTITGSGHLVEVRVEVPWSHRDSGTSKLWAANRFTGVLVEQLSAA